MTIAVSPIQEFRNELLVKTIDWCTERSPYYRERFGAAADRVKSVDDLYRLPVLRRDDVLAHHSELLCERVQPARVQYTTGTTGKRLFLYRSPAEQAFISDFFSRVTHCTAIGQSRPLFLSLTTNYHGDPTAVPGFAYVLTAGAIDRTQASQARAILERRFDFPGVDPYVTAIVGGDLMIKALTAYLMSEGVDPASTAVRHLIFTGGYVSTSRKHLLSELWDASVHDRYSLSEVFGGAAETQVGGPWAFDSYVIPEAVHPRTMEPIRDGIGLLVLTGLYPFMQMMPMVRYDTGDLVEIVEDREHLAPDLQVRFLGRLRRSIIDDTGDRVVPLLVSGPVFELLEALPDIGWSGRFQDLEAGLGSELVGKPHFEVEHSLAESSQRGVIRLRLGLRYAPWLYPQRWTQLANEIRHGLYRLAPELEHRVHRGEIGLTLEPAPYNEVKVYNAK